MGLTRQALRLEPGDAAILWGNSPTSQIAQTHYQLVNRMVYHCLDEVAAYYQMRAGDFLYMLESGLCPPGICIQHSHPAEEMRQMKCALVIHGNPIGEAVVQFNEIWGNNYA